ncbi:MAG: DUF3794 domain-containing protein [Bacillota bacterium]
MKDKSKDRGERARVTQTRRLQLGATAVKLRRVLVRPENTVTTVIPNKVVVQGTLHKQVFFVGADDIVKHFGGDFPFSHMMDVPGAAPGMHVLARVEVEAVESELVAGGQEIEMKVVLKIHVKVTQPVIARVKLDPVGELIRVEELVGAGSDQLLVPMTVTLPASAQKIDEVRDLIEQLAGTVQEDAVLVQGVVYKQVFFVDTAGTVRHVAASTPFATLVSVPGAEPGQQPSVTATIQSRVTALVDPVTVQQQLVIALSVQVTKIVELLVATDPSARRFKIDHIVATGHGQALASPSQVHLDFPALSVGEVTGSIVKAVGKPVEDNVVVQGQVAKDIPYQDQDGVDRLQHETVSFAALVWTPGAAEGMDVQVKAFLEPITTHLEPPSTLIQNVVVKLELAVTEHRQLHLVEDQHGPPLAIELVVGETTSQVLVVDRQDIVPVRGIQVVLIRLEQQVDVTAQILVTARLELDAIKIRRIDATIGNLIHHIINGNVLIQGTVEKQVFFVGPDSIVHHAVELVPFSHLLELPPGLPDDTGIVVEAEVENVVYHLMPGLLDQKVILFLRARAVVRRELEVVDVFGPGVTVLGRAQIFVFVVLEGVERWLEVVTNVGGPAVISVTKETLVVPVFPEPEPQAIQVVTGVVLSPV